MELEKMVQKIVIVASELDIASKNIGRKILEIGNFKKVEGISPYETYKDDSSFLVWHTKDLIEDDITDLDKYFNPELYVIVFRHLGRAETPRLTVHPAGNFTLPKENSPVPYRGEPHRLAYVHPAYMKEALKFMNNLVEEKNLGYSVSYEVTHHTPTELKRPVMFLEIGDTVKHHNDERAIAAAAETALHLLNSKPGHYDNCLAVGGGHYAERFTRRALNENYAFGHFIASYSMPDITPDVVSQAIDKTVGGVKYAVFDSKDQGSSEDRQKIINVLNKRNIEIIKLPK